MTTIFDQNPCNTSCRGRVPHTICYDIEDLSCGQNHRIIYDTDRKLLISGHNGLRDRIARIMNVSSMIELTWSVELEEMAINSAFYCKPFEDDQCAHTGTPLSFKDQFEQFSSGRDGYQYIVQNRYCIRSKFYPDDIVERAIRDWYFEKSDLNAPTFRDDWKLQKRIGILKGENNFTHLAHPFTNRIGCAVAKMSENFCVLCFYYPFYRSFNDTMEFLSGEPCSSCPAYFPLISKYFPSICTGGYGDDADNRIMKALGIKMFFLTLISFFL